MKRPAQLASQRGISLIEAVVALGVMAFGILGIAGIQASLRASSDISKQRAEASRLAQQLMEERRNFVALGNSGTAGVFGYADLTTQTPANVVGSNATFTRNVVVTDATAARMKHIQTTVQWTDRAGATQSVQMLSSVSRVAPELAASLGVPPISTTTRLPRGRNLQIPRQAADQGDGTSSFAPPGGGSLRWIFNNATGYITRICSDPSTCTDVNARLLAGFVRFALGSSQPSSSEAESPSDNGPGGIDVVVTQTAPTTGSVACFENDQNDYVAYFCAVPVTSANPRWSGRSLLTGLSLASSIASTSSSERRVCRYTTTRAQTTVPTISNAEHPLDYVDVEVGLQNQNFLVIRAGNGTTAFDCPADNTGTTFINGNTWHHQPEA